MSNFKVGQKVVCVKKALWSGRRSGVPCKGPTLREVCTVTGVKVFTILLAEYPVDSERFAGYDKRSFRPIVNQECGMEMLRELLQPKEEKVLS